MSFASLWPLAFVLAIPVIIILYLLKPRGTDLEISSNLLWKHIFKNVQSKTFFEKFIHELLMYLQMVIMLLLILALMAPFIMTKSFTGGSTVIVIDNSFSMQHQIKQGKTRLDEAKDEALEYISSEFGDMTVISASDTAKILITSSSDRKMLRSAISSIEAEDTEGNAGDLYSILSSLEYDHIIILTDGFGCAELSAYADNLKADIIDVGEAVSDISIDYIYAAEKDGATEVSVRYTDYSDLGASMDISLYDDQGNIIDVRSASAEAGKSASVLFTDIPSGSRYYRAELSSIRFDGEPAKEEAPADGEAEDKKSNVKVIHDFDSLSADNIAYALSSEAGNTSGMLISNGNTFIERAFYASTGTDLVRAVSDNALAAQDCTMVIYDAGFGRDQSQVNSMEFLAGGEKGTLSNRNITVKKCDLTEGLDEFTIGANTVNYYDVPEWAQSFMESDGKCVGYYGINGGHKQIVIGFDIRESDFALQAEFPVFMAESISFLSDLGMLAQNTYETGNSIIMNPLPEYIPISGLPEGRLNKAGLFYISAGARIEYYTVTAPAYGRDGRVVSEDLKYSNAQEGARVKKNLRNILLIVALVLLVLEWILYVKKMNYRKKFYLVLRTVLLALVILALLGIRIPKKAKDTTTIFLVDMSVSDERNLELFEDYIDDALKNMPKNNRYGIVGFGRDAVVDQFVTDRDMFMGIDSDADPAATNFEKALQRAISMIPADSVGRIVVLTDGRETAGDITNSASMITSGRISLEAYMIPSETGDDCYVEKVDVPNVLHPGDSFYMTVALESNYETDAVVSIMSGEKVLNEEKVHLQKGHNEFVFEEVVEGNSLESFHVEVLAEGDTCAENNVFNAYSEIADAPKILVIKGAGENGLPFENLLGSINANAEIIKPSSAPSTLNEILEYRVVILENAYYSELPEEFVELLDTYVKDYGRGLIMTGGEDSFMLGGYNDTAIEKILPVNMELRSMTEIPSTAIVMVIDHSGSMDDYAGNGFTILDLAVESAKRAVDNMREEDEVGVLGFDDYYHWYHNLSVVGDKDAVKYDIDAIGSGGGTVIMPALEEARKALMTSNAEIKHIILLTDGMGETTNFSSVTNKINSDGITLSTVAVGQYSDTQLMSQLAKDCNGRYYYADGSTDLPRIFAQEVFLGGNTYLKNGQYQLSVASHEITQGLFADGWTDILGYIAASPKDGAQQLILSSEGDPILTVWQYGLGRSIAWNSDVDGGWTAGYSGEGDYAEMWRRMIDYSCGSSSIGEDYVKVKTEGEQTVLEYHTDEYDDRTEINAVFTTPDGGTGEVDFTASEPGVYRAVFDSIESGLYNINVRRSDDGTVQGVFTTASVVQYSDEFRFDMDDRKFSSFIDQYGIWLASGDNIWKKLNVTAVGSFDLTDIFLILSILLFLSDIAGRRFAWEPLYGAAAKERREKKRLEREERKALKAAAEYAEQEMPGGPAPQMPQMQQMPQPGQGMPGAPMQQTPQMPNMPQSGQGMPGAPMPQMSQMPNMPQSGRRMPGAPMQQMPQMPNMPQPGRGMQRGPVQQMGRRMPGGPAKPAKGGNAPVSQGLDTSALLNKKNRRDNGV